MEHNKKVLQRSYTFVFLLWAFIGSTTLAQLNNPAVFPEQLFFENCEDGNLAGIRDAISTGIDPSTTDDQGISCLIKASFEGHSDIIKFLIESGAEINHTDRYGANALMYAASQDHAETVSLLINAGANLNARDTFHGWTALMYAAFEGNAEVVNLLSSASADVNLAGAQNGWTPLMFASHRGHYETANILIQHGANIDMVNTFGTNAIQCAEKKGHKKVKKLLVRAGTKSKNS